MKLSRTNSALFGLALALSIQSFGQSNETIEPTPGKSYQLTTIQSHQSQNLKSASVPIWSEDFANGIPSTWQNVGYDGSLQPLAAAQWEYRGPNTTPNNNVGSRGAFTTGDTIASPTTSNGFVIFDSGFLDNNGQSSTIGSGVAPAPHVGTLTTDTIDLTGFNDVVLSFSSYARVFFANFVVEYSTDGGVTFPNSDIIYSDSILGVNGTSPNVDIVQRNVSSYIGGQSNVVLRFVFDGRPGNANGNGYYFWMLDDIEISPLPTHQLLINDFTLADAPDMWFGNPGQGKYGHISLGQTRPINFDATILNFGAATQTNVQLQVDVYGPNGASFGTYSSVAIPSLATGQVAPRNLLAAGSFTPVQTGTYDFVYSAVSDSVNFMTSRTPHSDTFQVVVSDTTWGLDFGGADNSIGTPNIGPDGSAIAVRHDILQDETVRYVDIYLSPTTVAGGVIEVTVLDSTGFSFANGFPSQPLVYEQITITQQHVNDGVVRADLTDNPSPTFLATSVSGSYYVVVTMFSNAGANPISILNDQTFIQPATAAIMYYTISSPRWYSGFTNNFTLNAPWIRISSIPGGCVNQVNLGEIKRACSSYTSPSGVVYTQSATGLTDSIGPMGGSPCSTIYSFDLTLGAQGEITTTACPSTQTTLPSGKVVVGPGSYQDTVQAAAGCDSLINVIILPENFTASIARSGNILSTAQNSNYTYQWIICSGVFAGPINGATSATYTVAANNDYAVIVDNGEGCVDTSDCFNVNDIGINETIPEDFNVYPVPSSDYLLVDFADVSGVISIEIIDLQGQVLRHVRPNGQNSVRMATSDLQNGIYLVKINTNEHSKRVRRFNVVH